MQQAGVAQGMRVLDVGSGNGDVALLGAPLVGPYNLSDAAQSALGSFRAFQRVSASLTNDQQNLLLPRVLSGGGLFRLLPAIV